MSLMSLMSLMTDRTLIVVAALILGTALLIYRRRQSKFNPKGGWQVGDDRQHRDPIVERVRQKLLDRSQFGLNKYGVGLDRTDLEELDWLRHHQFELLDAANYTEVRIKNLEEKIKQS